MVKLIAKNPILVLLITCRLMGPIRPYAALLLIGPLGRNFGDVGIIP